MGRWLCPDLFDHRAVGTLSCDDRDLSGATLGLAGDARAYCASELCYCSVV